MLDCIDELKFDENGLIPAVVVDARTSDVLTLAYMNRESLEISLKEGRTCFWSRSRGELWRKGETSGNTQRITGIKVDCDRDALAVYVDKDGPACHTGAESCFSEKLYGDPPSAGGFSLDALYKLILDRRRAPKEGSYTTYLFEKGAGKILKKIGEEATEVIIAGACADRAETVYELADLCYHCLVLMAEMGIPAGDVARELASRHVIDHKVKQEKMT
jgi:phosphoribosyl-ATP pyrophosphohydrolase/phosphoribosyl-AMP cyclohydrolase